MRWSAAGLRRHRAIDEPFHGEKTARRTVLLSRDPAFCNRHYIPAPGEGLGIGRLGERISPLVELSQYVTSLQNVTASRQAGGLAAISRWLIPRSGRHHRNRDKDMTIPEGWQRLGLDDDEPLMLASLRDAIRFPDCNRWYLRQGGSTTG